MWTWIARIMAWFLKGERATDVVDAYQKFSGDIIHRLEKAEQRLDECDDDRTELRHKVGALTIKVDECENDRDELKSRVDTLESKIA